MFKNILQKEIILSKLNNEIKHIKFDNYDYNYLHTDFILDTTYLFPISLKTKQTSTDLFSHFYYKKYEHFFSEDYFYRIHKNLNNIKQFDQSFVIGAHNNYYHLLIDILPRIFGINPVINQYINKIIFLKSNFKQNNIIETILKHKNITIDVKTIKNGTYKFNNSVFTIKQSLKNINYNYRKLFSKYLNNEPKKNIYISRADATQRKILNENEIIEKLKKLNFEVINLSNLNFVDQIKTFNNAKCIVTLHGAGLTNLIFSTPKATVIEIFPDLSNPSSDWYCNANNIKINNKFIRAHYIDISKINNLDHNVYFTKKITQNKLQERNFKMTSTEKINMSLTNTDVEVDFSVLYKLLKSKIY